MRALGIDYGRVRIGLAVSDEIGMLAHPLETVTENAIGRLGEIVAERKIEHVVIGLPLHLDGRVSETAKVAREFAEKLKGAFPESVEFHEIDERLTSKTAREKLHAAGRSEKEMKAILDQAAAVEILQDWLDSRNPPILLDEDDMEWMD
ncbi:MAG: Holliday junction resolvase RuvX [Verrucomicrobiota bacterium]